MAGLSRLRPAVTTASATIGPTVREADRRRRRLAFIARVKSAAAWAHADVDLYVHPDADIASSVRFTVDPWTSNVLHLPSRTRLDEDVRLALHGGTIDFAENVHMRRGVLLNVKGRLRIESGTTLSWSSIVHCDLDVHLMELVGFAEHVTVSDSSHYFTEPDEHFWHNVRSAPVVIGKNSWLCPKSTVAKGVTIGSHCIIGSNSVVTSDVPEGSLASGIPATYRPLHLPWRSPAP